LKIRKFEDFEIIPNFAIRVKKMTMAKILVIDDERSIRNSMKDILSFEGHEVVLAENGMEGLVSVKTEKPEVVFCDIKMPKMEGIEVLERIKEFTSDVPVIILTARGNESDRVAGLDAGADDYVVKPFLPRELTARVRAVLRRRGAAVIAGRLSPMPSEETASTADEERVIVCGPLKLNEARFEATAAGKPLKLSAKEFKLLSLFAAKPGRVFSRANLLDAVWQSAFVDERTVDVHMLRLRKALAGSAAEDMIETVRGVGYRFRDPQTALNTPASE